MTVICLDGLSEVKIMSHETVKWSFSRQNGVPVDNTLIASEMIKFIEV